MTGLIRLQRMRSNGQAFNTRKPGKRAVESAVLSGVNLKFISSCAETAHATTRRDFKLWLEILGIRRCALRKSAATGRCEHGFYSFLQMQLM